MLCEERFDKGALERLPVTLAGDSADVVQNRRGRPAPATTDLQTISPLGALVQSLNCDFTWSNRKGLVVKHPVLGVLKTGVSKSACPIIQESKALQLIAELEGKKLRTFEREIQAIESQLCALQSPLDPFKAVQRYAASGDRRDMLAMLFCSPTWQACRTKLRQVWQKTPLRMARMP